MSGHSCGSLDIEKYMRYYEYLSVNTVMNVFFFHGKVWTWGGHSTQTRWLAQAGDQRCQLAGLEIFTLSPIIMEVKNHPQWKETNIGGIIFLLEWLEEVYKLTPWFSVVWIVQLDLGSSSCIHRRPWTVGVAASSLHARDHSIAEVAGRIFPVGLVSGWRLKTVTTGHMKANRCSKVLGILES